jgi:hypothetical protein
LSYLDSVRNLCLHSDRQLNWRGHVSHVIKRVYSTISLLNRFKRSTSCDLRIYLSYLYFRILTLLTLQVFPVSRFIGYNLHSTIILGCDLFTYLQCRLVCFIHSVHIKPANKQLCETIRLYTVVFVFGILFPPLLKTQQKLNCLQTGS